MLSRKNVCLLLFASLAVMTAAGLSAVVFGQAPAAPVPSSGPSVGVDVFATDAEPPTPPAETPADAVDDDRPDEVPADAVPGDAVPGDATNVAPSEGVSRTVTTVISDGEPSAEPKVRVQRSVSTGRSFSRAVAGPQPAVNVPPPGARGRGGYGSRQTPGAYNASPYQKPSALGAPGFAHNPYQRVYPHQRVREADPELAKLLQQDAEMEQQAAQLAEAYRRENDQVKRAKSKADLEELAKQHFDLRQQRRQYEVAQLEKQLKRIRAAIEKRTQAKDLIIQRHLAKLLGEEDDLAF